MSNKTNIPNETIEKAATIEKVWLEATTINILPGEEINFKLQEEKNKELQPNNKELFCSATVDEDGKARVFFASADIETNKKVTKKGYFTKGWWSIDKAGKKPITRAIPGMLVYFHIETKDIPDGKKVALELYDDDNNEKEESGSGDKDDHQKLVIKGTGIKVSHKPVLKNKIVYAMNLTLKNAIENEKDKQLELYFRCSYNKENVELPHSPKDYLILGTLVIDRYKMPGLNASGTDIADDLTYGYGIKHSGSIYNTSEISQYIKEYKELGFNETNHSLFSNIDSFDDKNRKAIYDKKEMYGVKVKKDYESGKDLKEFNEGKSPITNKWRDDDYLFWDFKNTAELYFARGELQTNLDKMIAKFKSNTGGIFEDAILTKYVNSHPNTNKYCLAVEDYISDRLKQDFKNDITKIEDKDPYFEVITTKEFSNSKGTRKDNHKRNFTKPAYSYGGSGLIDKAKGIIDATKGLTIALNDIWATEVILTELNNDGDNYTVKYSVTLWDHFGLDIPDMQKNFNTYASVKEAFICWFVLQHLRGYKPFVTKITFEREFKGNFNQTGKESRKIKKAEDDAKWMRENKRAWDKATNPWAPGSKL